MGARGARLFFIVTLWTALLGPLPAWAQDPSAAQSAAQTLFDQSIAQMQAGDLAHACPGLEEVARLLPGRVGTLTALGTCHERAGRLASAWARLREAADAARLTGDTTREAPLRERAAALEPRLARISIRATSPHAGLRISQDGVDLPAGAWSRALPIDAGPHTLAAAAPGHAPWTKVVNVADGARVEVDVPALAEERAPAPASGPRATVGPPPERADGGVPTWSWVLGGAGAGAAVASVPFVAWWADADRRFGIACPSTNAAGAPVCISDLGVVDAIDAERTRAAALAIGFGATGAVALVVAVVGAVRSGDSEVARNDVTLSIGATGGTLRGAW